MEQENLHMYEDSDAIPTESLEDVAYLSRSANRVAILDALTSGPHTRRDLAEMTGASRTTLDRIVNELEDRNWAERSRDGGYVATSEGIHLMQEFRPFLEAVEGVRQLGSAVDWLPDDLDIGLQHFRDAYVREPSQDDPVETVKFMTELVREASNIRILTHLEPPASFLQAIRDRVVAGQLTLEAMTPREYSEFPTEQSNRRNWWLEIIEADADLYLCDGPIPCNLWIIDETVLIKKSHPGPIDDSYGAPIISTDSTVRSWAHDVVDQYRADAQRIDLEMLPESSAQSGDS